MNPQSLLVQDYMQSSVATLPVTATFQQAVETMLEKKTNGLVIVHTDRTVVGILSCWDLIAYLVPNYLEQDKHLASFEASETFSDRIKVIANNPISQFMTKKVHTVFPNHTLMEAASLLSEHGIRQLPVVDQSGKLIGYINRTDIKRAMGDVLKSGM